MGETSISWTDVAFKSLQIIEPVAPFLWGLLLLWILIRITDASIRSTIRDVIREFAAFLDKGGTLKSLRMINALGGVLFFVLAVFLFFAGLAHIKLPEHDVHTSDTTRIVYLGVLFFLGLYFILCIRLTKSLRD